MLGMSTSWPTGFSSIGFVYTGFLSKISKHRTYLKIYNAIIILFNLFIIFYYFLSIGIRAHSVNRRVIKQCHLRRAQ